MEVVGANVETLTEIYICRGHNGYVPKEDPNKMLFGCKWEDKLLKETRFVLMVN